MKRLLIFSFSLILVSGAYAQEFKFIGGSSLSRYIVFPERVIYSPWDQFYTLSYKSSYKPGFLLGAGIEFPLAKHVGLEIDGFYFKKGGEVKELSDDIPYEKRNYALKVISLPVLVKVKFLPNSSPYILHGGEFSYVLSHKYERTYEGPGIQFPQKETIDIKEETKSFTLGVVVGGGFEIKTGGISFFIEARYHFGLINIISDQAYSLPFQSIKANSQVILFGLKI